MNLSSASSSGSSAANVGRTHTAGALTAAQQQQLAALQRREQQVRAHEQAHLAASGGLATSGARYSYQLGADGKRYAVGGEVSIEVSPGPTPQQTLTKAQQIYAAALAPAQPSAQDRAVAQLASRMALQAQQQLYAASVADADTTRLGSRLQRAYAADDGQPRSGQLINTSA